MDVTWLRDRSSDFFSKFRPTPLASVEVAPPPPRAAHIVTTPTIYTTGQIL